MAVNDRVNIRRSAAGIRSRAQSLPDTSQHPRLNLLTAVQFAKRPYAVFQSTH
jgi:hypothetical protein